MLLLLKLYFWTVLAGMGLAATLSLLGGHLAARDKAMQTLCVSQGAMVGVLLSLGLFERSHYGISFVPTVGALLFAFFSAQVTEFLVRGRTQSRNTLFALVFSALLALSYLVSSLFPALEGHIAHVYFGDLAVLTRYEVWGTLITGALGFLVLMGAWRVFARQSFEEALFGHSVRGMRSPGAGLFFDFFTLLVLCLSVQWVGYLFTIACLFIPTAVLSFHRTAGLKSHMFSCVLVSVLGTLAGFSVSMTSGGLPTVPTIVTSLLILSLMALAASRLKRFLF